MNEPPMATSQTSITNAPPAGAARRPKRGVPEGLWQRCPGCQATIFRKEAEQAAGRLPGVRLSLVRFGPRADRASARRRHVRGVGRAIWSRPIRSSSPTRSPIATGCKQEQARTGLRDAAVVGTGMIRARRVAFGVTDSAFIMGSMGSVVGEKLTRLIERATEQRLPLIIISGFGRRRPHARGHLVADADGQGLGGAGSLRSGRRACSSPC